MQTVLWLAACSPTCPVSYLDLDGDGFGDGASAHAECDAPSGRATVAGDCDDNASAVHPGATETCNGRDDDCDQIIDPTAITLYFDYDQDGYGDDAAATAACAADPDNPFLIAQGGDCDDTSAAVNPGADERCNTLDDDCDGRIDIGDTVPLSNSIWWRDADGDGQGDPFVRSARCAADADG